MDLLSIAAFVFSLSFAILVFFLIRVLGSLVKVVTGLEKTVEQLPEHLDNITSETKILLQNSNETLQDVHNKMDDLNPLFAVVKDAGVASQKLTNSLVDLTSVFRKDVSEGKELVEKKQWNGNGALSAITLLYVLYQRRKKS